MLGTVAHECSMNPIMNDKYKSFLQLRKAQSEVPIRQIQVLDAPQHTSNVSLNIQNRHFGNFTGNRRRTVQATGNTDKGVRVEKSELLDQLFMRFEEYEYWTLRGLKEVTRQPEGWLKEVLSEVGTLVKKGPYALKWTLKPEYKGARLREKQEQ